MPLAYLECGLCGTRRDVAPANVCDCGGTLFARYDLAAASKSALLERGDLWRYLPLLPVDKKHIVTLGEGGTPLLHADHMGKDVGLRQLYVKDEGVNPTGSFKARGLAVAVSAAKSLGMRRLAVPSAGNAGVALAAYAARAGVEATVVVPRRTPGPMIHEMHAYGATVKEVGGTIQEAGEAVRALTKKHWFSLATAQEPYRIEGKKTMAFEVWEQLGRAPDWVVFPTGGGTGVLGLWKGFAEMRDAGWTKDPPPRIALVQGSRCAPLARALETGAEAAEPWPSAAGIAPGLIVPKPYADRLILKFVRESHGVGLAVDDKAMVTAATRLAQREGISAGYEGGAALAAVERLAGEGLLGRDETVVVFNTANATRNPPKGLTARAS